MDTEALPFASTWGTQKDYLISGEAWTELLLYPYLPLRVP